MRELCSGYHIFYAISKEDYGFEKVAQEIESQIRIAERDFDITFLSGPSFKDDPGGRNLFFGSQGAVLKEKSENV